MFGSFAVAVGNSVECPKCGQKGFANKSAETCICRKCGTEIVLKEKQYMFQGAKIGRQDMHERDICEGDTVRFRSIVYENNSFEGIVRYSIGWCGFIIETSDNKGDFRFNAEITNLEVIR